MGRPRSRNIFLTILELFPQIFLLAPFSPELDLYFFSGDFINILTSVLLKSGSTFFIMRDFIFWASVFILWLDIFFQSVSWCCSFFYNSFSCLLISIKFKTSRRIVRMDLGNFNFACIFQSHVDKRPWNVIIVLRPKLSMYDWTLIWWSWKYKIIY